MMQSSDYLRLLADLFDYPTAMFPERVHRTLTTIGAYCPAAVADLERFSELLPDDDLIAMQELYTRTFDVQAITTLDLGYVLFGDDYKRGELLSNLNREHTQHHNDCGSELADHLPNVLRLIPLLDDKDLAAELVTEIIAPALSQMIGEFSPERVQKKYQSYQKQYKTLIEQPRSSTDVATLYQHALKALYAALKANFTIVEKIPLLATSDFLKSLSAENAIEDNAKAFY
jgi:nitrate reductase assembly molybdenum cofactor insertion protein NarJ